jgi:protein TonB
MSRVDRADLTDIVFEDRYKDYGAYDLRKRYIPHLFTSTGIVLVLFLVLYFAPQVSFSGNKEEEDKVKKTGTITLADLPPPPPVEEDEAPPPPPPPKPPPPKLKQIAFKIPEPKPKDQIVEEERIEENKMLDTVKAVISTINQEGEETDVFNAIPTEGEGGDGPPEVIAEEEPDVDAFVFVSEEPQPLNMDDIVAIIGYPDVARDANIQGQVVVRVLVDEKGKYRRHKMVKRVHPILAEAVENNLHKLKFSPAIQGNRPIKFWVNIPFRFKLMN